MFQPRTKFILPAIKQTYFPGHQKVALDKFKSIAGSADVAIELRDSRAPVSSINPLIGESLAALPRIVLYTKIDNSLLKKPLVKPLHLDNNFHIIRCDRRNYAQQVLAELKKRALDSFPPRPLGLRVLITGMPNVGKSSLINEFRQLMMGRRSYKKPAKTGNQPGVTRAISNEILINKDPRITVLDTPGLLVPHPGPEQTLRLALIGAIPRKTIDPVILADYLLFHINRLYPKGGIYPGPLSNNIHEVLASLAESGQHKTITHAWSDENEASIWLDRFSSGRICRLTLDSEEDVQDSIQCKPMP